MTTTDNSKPSPQFRKVDFAEYEGKYDSAVSKTLRTSPDSLSIEALREYIYGYTFTEGYANGVFPDEMTMDYWTRSDDAICDLFVPAELCDDVDLDEPSGRGYPYEDDMAYMVLNEFKPEMGAILSNDNYRVDTLQERCLLNAIDSTGDGKTKATALCVIAVGQEYEYLSRVMPYCLLQVVRQTVDADNIDCLEFADNAFGIRRIYFDIHRRFDVGYPRRPSKETKQ